MIGQKEAVPAILDVVVNEQAYGPSVLIREGESLLARVTDIDRWRLKRSALKPEVRDGEAYLPLSGFPDVAYSIDEEKQTLTVKAQASAFEPVTIDADRFVFRDPTDSAFGAFLNYDAAVRAVRGPDSIASFFEAGMSNRWGLITNTFVASSSPGQPSFVRYDTTYRWDNPKTLTRVTLGDTLSHGADIGRPVRFAGVRYGTAFELQPSLITFPTPSFSGQAALPSTVQVYVNGVLNYSRSIDQGPFGINRLPTLTGAGDMRVVVKDPLGIERAFDVPYYVGIGNLRKGLTDFSVEAGAERRGYGQRSFDYGSAYGAATYRRGISDAVTLGIHAEADQRVRMVEANSAFVLGSFGEIGLGAAASTSAGHTGTVGSISFRRQDRIWNVYFAYQAATSRFTQAGVTLADDRLRRQFYGSGGVSLGRFGTVSLSYIDTRPASGRTTRVATLTHNIRIGEVAQLSSFMLVTDQAGSRRATSVGLGLTIPLGIRRNAGARVESQQGHIGATLDVSQNPPTDRGFGYYATVAHDRTPYGAGTLTWVSPVSTVTAQVDHRSGTTSGLLEASGSIGAVAGTTFFARQIGEAYGVVTVPDRPGVTIFQENRPIARTDARGNAVIPNLVAYQENRLSIDPITLPIDTEIKSAELKLVPRYRSAVAAKYAVRTARSATIPLLLPDGVPIPAGARVVLVEDDVGTYSGYRGEVFVEGIRNGVHLRVVRENGDCVAVIQNVPASGMLMMLPPATCQPVNR